MSLRYKIIKNVIRLAGIKKMSALPEEDLLRKIRKANRKRGFRLPKDHRCVYGDRRIGKYHCLTMQTGPKHSEKAILFFFGGGYLMGPDGMDIATARKLGRESGADVWFPYYPLCTEVCVSETFDMALECYRQLLTEYRAENISIVGASSGGALAIGLLLHNNALGRPLPVPRRVIAVSPGAVPVSDEERKRAQALDARDVMVTAAFMDNVRTFLEHGRKVPLYMLSGISGDFSGLPELYFYYGTDEVLCAEAEPFAAACEKYGVPYRMTVGTGMFHCYALMPFFPEGKAAHQEIIRILNT